MILLLNILPWLLALAGAVLSFKLRRLWVLLATVVLLAVYLAAQPSYTPKGTVQRSAVPAFSESDATIEDRNSKPVSGEERDRRMKEAVQKGLDFKP